MEDGGVAGYSAGLILMISWGMAPALASRASRLCVRFDSMSFNAWRNLAAVPLLAALLPVTGIPSIVDPASFALGLLLGTVMGSMLGDYYLVKGVSVAGASYAVPASYTYVVWINAIALLLGRTGGSVMAAALAAFAGIFISSEPWKGVGEGRAGVLYGLTSSALWTVGVYGFDLASSSLEGGIISSSVFIALARSVLASFLMASWISRWIGCLRATYRETVGASIIGYVVGYMALNASIALLGPALSAVFLSGVPVLSIPFSSMFAGEKPGYAQLLGGILVGVAIYFAL